MQPKIFMKNFTLDANNLLEREGAHTYIASLLSFPDYYGHNLDALHDILTDICEPVTLIIKDSEVLKREQCYGTVLIKVLKDSAEENEFLTVLEK